MTQSMRNPQPVGGNGTYEQVGWWYDGPEPTPEAKRFVDMATVDDEGPFIEPYAAHMVPVFKRASQPSACFCGDPSKPDVAHRSHECLAIGPQAQVDNMREEARQIGDALRYCLTGVEIIGCPSPSLMDEALERLERMANRGQSDG